MCSHTWHNLRRLWQLLRRCWWFIRFQFVWNWFQNRLFGASKPYLKALLLSWARNFSNSCHNWDFRTHVGCECVEAVLHGAPFITILSFTFLFQKFQWIFTQIPCRKFGVFGRMFYILWGLILVESCVSFSGYILVRNFCVFAKLASTELKNIFQGKFWIFMSMVVSSEWSPFHLTWPEIKFTRSFSIRIIFFSSPRNIELLWRWTTALGTRNWNWLKEWTTISLTI